MRLGTTVLTVGAVAVVGIVTYYLFHAEIDNWRGVGIARDISVVKNAPSRNSTIEQIVSRTYGGCVWRGHHRDEIWRTFVECYIPNDENTERVLYWEVDTDFSPITDSVAKGVFIIALTRETGALTPEYVPRGLQVDDLPTTPSMSARALYGLVRRR